MSTRGRNRGEEWRKVHTGGLNCMSKVQSETDRRLYGGGRGNVAYIGQRNFNVELPGTRKRRAPQRWFTDVIKEDRELV